MLALAIASGCGPKTASPTGKVTVPDTAAAAAAPLDEAGCLALLVDEPAARTRCDKDTRGPCVNEISLEQVQASPASYVCVVLVTREDGGSEDGEEATPISTEGTYTLALLDAAEGAWSVRDTRDSRYWSLEIESEDASHAIETVGPGKKAVVVRERRGMGAYFTEDVTFLLVTPEGLTEIFSFKSEVGGESRREVEHAVDDKTTTAGYHDIVLWVSHETYNPEDEESSAMDGSWEERYRWNGEKYEELQGAPEGE